MTKRSNLPAKLGEHDRHKRRNNVSIRLVVRDGFNIVDVSGDLDDLTAWRLGTAIVDGNEGRPLVIDLRRATSITRAGVRGLLQTSTPIAVVCAPGGVARFLEISPSDSYVPICTDLDTALALLTVAQLD